MEREIEESAITERTALSERIALVNTRDTRIDEERLFKALHANPLRTKVVSLHITDSSRLNTLAAVKPLTDLQEVRIASSRLRDYRALPTFATLRILDIAVRRRSVPLPDLSRLLITQLGIGPTLKDEPAMIGSMRSLRVLVVMYVWPESTLHALRPLGLTSLEIKTSTISGIGELDCRELALVACRGCAQLVSAHGVDAESVDIDTCRKLDLNTLSGEKIRVLALRNMKRIENMEFLKNCPNLRELEVTATRLSPDCVPQIAATKRLALADLYGLKKKDLQRLSALAREAVITDGLNTFRGGFEIAGA